MTGLRNLAVVIPAHRPSEDLIEIVRSLSDKQFGAIVVVDDGSGPEYRETFAQAAALPGAKVLRHAVNLGEGAALKTAFNHILCDLPDLSGVVTADVDSQPADVERAASALLTRPGSKDVPLVSRVIDAATGGIAPEARGIPMTMLPRLLRASSQAKLARFAVASLISAILDNLVFFLAMRRFGSILAALALARLFSVPLNYQFLRDAVFHRRAGLVKYVAWTIVSGGCSYAGILLLTAHGGMGAIPAKLLAETLLFPINFAVQRSFIFARRGTAPRLQLFAVVLGAVFFALVGTEIYGLRTSDLFSQDLWHPAGLRRFERYAEIYAVISAVLIFAVPRYFAAFFATVVTALTVVAVGPAALLATAFFLISANALGSRVMGRLKSQLIEDDVCATLLGAAIYSFVMTFMARLPVNYPAVWGAILAVPVLLDTHGVRERISGWISRLWPARRPPVAERAAFALLLFVLVAHWLVAIKPEQTADGLAMHLSIPANIAMQHRLTLEPARFLWAVMPMAADFAYSIVYLLGGEYATHLLVYAMLLAACTLLYSALRRWTGATAACLLTASFAATPIVQLVTGGLFVENFLAAIILGVLTAIWRLGDTGERRYFYMSMALGGTAIAVKLGALGFVLFALPFGFLEVRRRGWSVLGSRPAAACAAGLALMLAIAAPPYAVAYVKTRNPIFPYLNNKFHSPLMPAGVVIADARFKKPLSVRTPFNLTFHTDGYYEGQRGSLGFHYLLFVPLGLLGFAVVRRRVTVSAAVVAFGAGAVILSTEPNARYLYAAMPLALIPVGATLAWVAGHQRALYRTLIAFLIAAVGLDLYFLPSASYYHKDFALKQPFSRVDRDRYLTEAAPIRKVVEYFNQAHAGQGVLLTGEGSNAGLDGEIYENHWHQVASLLKIREAADVPAMLKLMNGWKVRYFIGRKPAPGELAEPPVLAEFLASCTLPEFEVGDAYLARLDPGCGAKNIIEPVLVVRPGYYDDWDPAIVYQGPWTKESGADGPDRQTRTHTETLGAQMSLAFDGKALYYVFSRLPNGGIASVTIDGAARAPIDMYYPVPDWQHKVGYCCFSPGRHVVVIRATGEKNPASSGYGVDLDSFSVLDQN